MKRFVAKHGHIPEDAEADSGMLPYLANQRSPIEIEPEDEKIAREGVSDAWARAQEARIREERAREREAQIKRKRPDGI